MKMADGGYRPAYNVQLATDVDARAIVWVEVTNVGSDMNALTPMLDQIKERTERLPEEQLVDGGFASRRTIEAAAQRGVTVYAPNHEARPKPCIEQAEAAVGTRLSGTRGMASAHGNRRGKGNLQTPSVKGRYRQR